MGPSSIITPALDGEALTLAQYNKGARVNTWTPKHTPAPQASRRYTLSDQIVDWRS
jgi:hypothetical protein